MRGAATFRENLGPAIGPAAAITNARHWPADIKRSCRLSRRAPGRGWERSALGYPISDEYAVPGGRRTTFQDGTIT